MGQNTEDYTVAGWTKGKRVCVRTFVAITVGSCISAKLKIDIIHNLLQNACALAWAVAHNILIWEGHDINLRQCILSCKTGSS